MFLKSAKLGLHPKKTGTAKVVYACIKKKGGGIFVTQSVADIMDDAYTALCFVFVM